MSNLPILCNACKQPTGSCSCARNTMYPAWPQAMQFQTPRRPQHFNALNSFTPHSRVPVVPFYPPYPQQMYDPRFQGFTMPSAMHPVPQSQHLHPSISSQATPLQQLTQTPLELRPPLSPTQPLPAPANGQKRKRANGAKTAAPKRTRRSQAQPQVSDENASLSSIPGVGPSSHVRGSPAARPQPIANYSPIAKAHKVSQSKQVASDVWYFMRPLDARERPKIGRASCRERV